MSGHALFQKLPALAGGVVTRNGTSGGQHNPLEAPDRETAGAACQTSENTQEGSARHASERPLEPDHLAGSRDLARWTPARERFQAMPECTPSTRLPTGCGRPLGVTANYSRGLACREPPALEGSRWCRRNAPQHAFPEQLIKTKRPRQTHRRHGCNRKVPVLSRPLVPDNVCRRASLDRGAETARYGWPMRTGWRRFGACRSAPGLRRPGRNCAPARRYRRESPARCRGRMAGEGVGVPWRISKRLSCVLRLLGV